MTEEQRTQADQVYRACRIVAMADLDELLPELKRLEARVRALRFVVSSLTDILGESLASVDDPYLPQYLQQERPTVSHKRKLSC